MTADHRQSVPPRTRDEIDALDRIDQRARELAMSFGAREMQYPALIAREVLERAGYPRAFPHLLMFASRNVLPEPGDTGQSPSADRKAGAVTMARAPTTGVCHRLSAITPSRNSPGE
jgi:hypothetical protein